MRVGVIADIHSNIYAFKACISRLEQAGCEEYIFLGDYVSDTPYTRETMDYLYEVMDTHKCTVLRGNREEYVIDQRRLIRSGADKGIWIKNSASGNLLYTYERLNDADIDFFESLPISAVYAPEGYPAITIAHGSPNNNRELLQHDGENTKAWLEKIDTDYLICGHTHITGTTSHKGKLYMNTGAAGISIGTPGLAPCMVLEGTSKAWTPEFLLVPYDNKKVCLDCFRMGLMDYAPWFINSNIQTLISGWDNVAQMVEIAKELMKAEEPDAEWPYMDEKYFKAAAERLGIPDYRDSDLTREI